MWPTLIELAVTPTSVAPPTAFPPPGVGAPGVGAPPGPFSTLPAPAPVPAALRVPPEAVPAAEATAGLFDLVAEPEAEAAAGEAELDPPDDTPADEPDGAAAEAPAEPESPGAAAPPESPAEYPPPAGAAAPPPWAETFWLWALRAARWAALPPQAAGIINPAVSTTKRRRDAMQVPPLLPSIVQRTRTNGMRRRGGRAPDRREGAVVARTRSRGPRRPRLGRLPPTPRLGNSYSDGVTLRQGNVAKCQRASPPPMDAAEPR